MHPTYTIRNFFHKNFKFSTKQIYYVSIKVVVIVNTSSEDKLDLPVEILSSHVMYLNFKNINFPDLELESALCEDFFTFLLIWEPLFYIDP